MIVDLEIFLQRVIMIKKLFIDVYERIVYERNVYMCITSIEYIIQSNVSF